MLSRKPRTIAELLSAYGPRVRRLSEVARRQVQTVVPGATEKLRPGWRLIGYDAPAYFAFIAPMRDGVRIGFEWGVLLRDQERVLEGDGRQLRSVTIRSAADLRSPALAE